MAVQRHVHEPSFVLHRHDWSETSLILEVFSRRCGRVALVAKGAKRPYSTLRPVLLPLQPLTLSFSGDAEIRTLKAAEWQGGHVMPVGEALLTGYYLNELLLKLLAREDPHPMLFDVYTQAVRLLALGDEMLRQAALRAFELLLLREIGLLPALDCQTLTLQPLHAQQGYVLEPQAGLRAALPGERAGLEGLRWLALQAALGSPDAWEATLRACAPVLAELKPQLRELLHYHCGVQTLRTRQMMIDLQSL